MRYDTAIFFQRLAKPDFDKTTGDYIEQPPVETFRRANVTESTDDRIEIEPGKVPEKTLVVRLQVPYLETYDFIRIGDKKYVRVSSNTLRSKQSIMIKEVQ